ncbi:MAG: squalene--hopene cyclase [Geminicoccaceae bacterium]
MTAAATRPRAPAPDPLTRTIEAAVAHLLDEQRADGHWLHELEADATIPAEHILLQHFLDEIDPALQARLAAYLRDIQEPHGGWPLFHGGDPDVSASVKAYLALKLAGDPVDAPHMRRARATILDLGGVPACNVFTRTTLALFGQVPWRAVPVMPVEIMLLPRSAPFHLSKVSYWSRTVIAPLLVLTSLKARARHPTGLGVAELFREPPERVRWQLANPTGRRVGDVLLLLDRVLRPLDAAAPAGLRRRAIEQAMAFVRERLNGTDGLGAIFPAIANAVMAMTVLGYPADHPDLVTAKAAIAGLVVERPQGRAYCQPCVSPIWDTGLTAHALLEAGPKDGGRAVRAALDWLAARQILDRRGDWAWQRPELAPGGWAFQYRNDHYPDVDDTAVVAMALHRADPSRYALAIERAKVWILGMQSRNGGWGAFDVDNDRDYLNSIPFADHGALLDPPTADVTARCLGMLAQLGLPASHPALARALAFLAREQEPDGSWFGRWGTNYVYGTWSVLVALNAAGVPAETPMVRRAVDWLMARQRADGGWGEDGASYWPERRHEAKASTPSQTAWALLGLMAAGEVRSEAVRRGVEHLLAEAGPDGRWRERHFNAVGFPRVFYLTYHGYAAYFPLLALARYSTLTEGRRNSVAHGF